MKPDSFMLAKRQILNEHMFFNFYNTRDFLKCNRQFCICTIGRTIRFAQGNESVKSERKHAHKAKKSARTLIKSSVRTDIFIDIKCTNGYFTSVFNFRAPVTPFFAA